MISALILYVPILIIHHLIVSYFFRKRVNWYFWDYGTFIYGFVAWFLFSPFGCQSLANLVEIIFVYFASFFPPWIRVIFPGNKKYSKISSLISALSIIFFSILLRLLMPCLPE